ncbi:hypothetical protein [Dongia deserti]|uniref:hypothetical protein n=1 Tax=Dongia deserti TaxID=2268030 RepID=UPI000E65177E|nr:hypothetical protein [Dongia deserti]
MQEIPRAILLPPSSQFSQRASARAVQIDSDSVIETVRNTRRPAPGAPHTFLTLLDSRREDTVEVKGKPFRFRPYNSRGAAEADPREADRSREASDAGTVGTGADDDEISVDIFDGFGDGAHARNSSTFLASVIAQERLRRGLYNPQFEAASNAYRRAGGSPSAIDNQPRVVSVAV